MLRPSDNGDMDYLTMPDLAERLHAGVREQESGGPLAAHIDIPFASQYSWTDDYGAPRTAHLPVGVSVGPSASADDDSCMVDLPADESAIDVRRIYHEAIAWAQRRYSSADGGDHLPQVPEDLLPVVRDLLG
jgi:hypothetical protein